MKTRKLTVILLWILVMLIISTEARLRISVSKSLGKIRSSLKSTKQVALSKITNFLESEDGSNAKMISSTIEAVGNAAPSLTSGDVTEIVSGALDIMSSVTQLIPMVGPIIGSIFSVISSLISSIGGGGMDIGSVVKKAIDEALRKFDDSNLRAKAFGTARVFGVSLAYLDGITDLQQHELSALSAHVPIYSGVEFLGILQSKITESSTSRDKQQVKRAMEYTRLFVKLTVLRSSVLWKMYIIVKQAGHSRSTASGIHSVIQTTKERDKQFLMFLTNPAYSRKTFFAHLNPSELPEVSKYLKTIELNFQSLAHLSSGIHKLQNQKWPSWFAYMYSDSRGSMWGTTHVGDNGYFYFDAISATDNTFYLRSYKWPNWYVYMGSDSQGLCYGWKGKPGPSGQWKIIKFSDGYYMLSPEKWLDWFLMMGSERHGRIKGWKHNPGSQGHWNII